MNGMPVCAGPGLEVGQRRVLVAQHVVALDPHLGGDVAHRRQDPHFRLGAGVGEHDDLAVAGGGVGLRQGRGRRDTAGDEQHQRFHRWRAYCRFAAMKTADVSRVDRRAFLTAAAGLAMAARAGAQAAQPPGVSGADASRLDQPDADAVSGPGHHRARSAVPPLRRVQQRHQAAAHRHRLGRRAGVERRGQILVWSDIPEQRADALDRGRRPRHDVPQPVRLQQRQHVRLRGPADLAASTAAAAWRATSRTAP